MRNYYIYVYTWRVLVLYEHKLMIRILQKFNFEEYELWVKYYLFLFQVQDLKPLGCSNPILPNLTKFYAISLPETNNLEHIPKPFVYLKLATQCSILLLSSTPQTKRLSIDLTKVVQRSQKIRRLQLMQMVA